MDETKVAMLIANGRCAAETFITGELLSTQGSPAESSSISDEHEAFLTICDSSTRLGQRPRRDARYEMVLELSQPYCTGEKQISASLLLCLRLPPTHRMKQKRNREEIL